MYFRMSGYRGPGKSRECFGQKVPGTLPAGFRFSIPSYFHLFTCHTSHQQTCQFLPLSNSTTVPLSRLLVLGRGNLLLGKSDKLYRMLSNQVTPILIVRSVTKYVFWSSQGTGTNGR